MIQPLTITASLVIALGIGAAAAAQDSAERLKTARNLELNEGKRTEAASIYREMLAANPASVDALTGLGRILAVEGKAAEARDHLNRARAAAPEDQRVAVLSALAIALVFDGNGGAAADAYRQVFERHLSANAISPAANAANALGRTLLETGDLDGAEKWYRTGYETAKKIQNVPAEEADIWEMRWRHAQGRIAARRKQFDAARTHLAAVDAIVAKGTLPEGQSQFAPQLAGYIAFYQGNYDEAISALGKADQDDPFVLVLLGRAYEQKKDAAKAKALYAQVLAQPGFSLQLALSRPFAAQRLR